MTPFEIVLMLEVSYRVDMRDSVHWGSQIYEQTLEKFVSLGLIEGVPQDEKSPKLTDRGKAYIHLLQCMPLPTANWSLPGPWNPSVPSSTFKVRERGYP